MKGVNCPGRGCVSRVQREGAFPSCTVSQLDDMKRVCQLSSTCPWPGRAQGCDEEPKGWAREQALREGLP